MPDYFFVGGPQKLIILYTNKHDTSKVTRVPVRKKILKKKQPANVRKAINSPIAPGMPQTNPMTDF